jgi:hypothetical protein
MWELLYNYIELIIEFIIENSYIGIYKILYRAQYRVFRKAKALKMVVGNIFEILAFSPQC